MSAMIVDMIEEGGEEGVQCFCFGVINGGDRQSPEYSKRFCMVSSLKTENEEVDVTIDLSDIEVAAIQSVLSLGTLNVLQRARLPKA